MRVGPSLQNFHYEETDAQNSVLDREDGFLPGVDIRVGTRIDHYTLLLSASLHGGTVDYDGHTQGGTPLATDTEERIVDVAVLVKHGIGPNGDSVRATGGAGYREWQRDIQATGAVSGLYEIYRWPYLMLGIEADLLQNGPWKAGIDVRLTRPAHPTIEVDAAGFDPLTLELGARYGANIGFPVEYRLASNRVIAITPYWQLWALEHSEYKRLYSNGVPTPYSAQEPDSETRIFGVAVTLHFSP